jgi:hypothetical protein
MRFNRLQPIVAGHVQATCGYKAPFASPFDFLYNNTKFGDDTHEGVVSPERAFRNRSNTNAEAQARDTTPTQQRNDFPLLDARFDEGVVTIVIPHLATVLPQ